MTNRERVTLAMFEHIATPEQRAMRDAIVAGLEVEAKPPRPAHGDRTTRVRACLRANPDGLTSREMADALGDVPVKVVAATAHNMHRIGQLHRVPTGQLSGGRPVYRYRLAEGA